jgi:hypothetical protein
MPTIDIQNPPITQPSAVRVDFVRHAFDDQIWNKGYHVIIEKALPCPCKTKGGDNLLSCINCGGSGFIFINPKRTRVLSTSISTRRDLKDWGVEDSGTIQITPISDQQLSYMDKITYLDSKCYFNEVIYLNNQRKGRAQYKINVITEIFVFLNPQSPLTPLNSDKYTILDNIITITDQTIPITAISVRYEHNGTYHVTELMREVMVTNVKSGTIDAAIQMPPHVTAKKAHYILQQAKSDPNTAIGELKDNSFEFTVT